MIEISIRIGLHSSRPHPRHPVPEVKPKMQIRLPNSICLDDDPLLEYARDLLIEAQRGSVAILQRNLRVGYARAARLLNRLEELGVVGPFRGAKARKVLISDR